MGLMPKRVAPRPEEEQPAGDVPVGKPVPEPAPDEEDVPAGRPGPGDENLPQGAEGEEASPEEQAMYDTVVALGLKAAMSDGSFGQVMKLLAANPDDPKMGLAKALVSIVKRVEQAAEEQGQEVPGPILLEAAKELAEHLGEMATLAGIYDFENDPDSLEGAFLRAVDEYRIDATERGKVDQGVMQQDLEAIKAEDQNGALKDRLMKMAGAGAEEEETA